MVDTDQVFEPKLSSRVLADGTMQSASLEDMAPFLDPKELVDNLISGENNNISYPKDFKKSKELIRKVQNKSNIK